MRGGGRRVAVYRRALAWPSASVPPPCPPAPLYTPSKTGTWLVMAAVHPTQLDSPNTPSKSLSVSATTEFREQIAVAGEDTTLDTGLLNTCCPPPPAKSRRRGGKVHNMECGETRLGLTWSDWIERNGRPNGLLSVDTFSLYKRLKTLSDTENVERNGDRSIGPPLPRKAKQD